MTRDEKVAEARRLRTQGLSYPRIAELIDAPTSTVWVWLNPGSEARRGPAKRAWENANDRGRCACGAAMGVGAKRRGSGVCAECRREMDAVGRAWRQQTIYELWHQGASLHEIAAALSTKRPSIGSEVTHMRKIGWDLPYRHQPKPDRAVA